MKKREIFDDIFIMAFVGLTMSNALIVLVMPIFLLLLKMDPDTLTALGASADIAICKIIIGAAISLALEMPQVVTIDNFIDKRYRCAYIALAVADIGVTICIALTLTVGSTSWLVEKIFLVFKVIAISSALYSYSWKR